MLSENLATSPDALEALSRRYFAHPVLRLSSGRYAVFAPGYGALRAIVDNPAEAVLDFVPPPVDNNRRRGPNMAIVHEILAKVKSNVA